jgi:hypothetical protein
VPQSRDVRGAPGYKPITVSGYPTEALEAGTEAPDFELKATPDQSVSLAEFRGRPSQIHVRKRLLAAIAALMAAFAFGMA